MKFLRLPDPCLSVLYEDDDIIAIDKPYGFNSHTNDSHAEHAEYIQEGLIEIYERQRKSKLHIIHRLDQTTTGVMIFGKSTESAKKYAEFFFHRQVQKTYLFITKSKSEKKTFVIDQSIIHKGRTLDAYTDLDFLKKTDQFELWRALPHTGRNHQIRIHAQAAQISILGDEKYGGHAFPFLCLHNCKIEFPNGIVIESRPPAYFQDLKILEDIILTKFFFEVDRRQRLFTQAGINESYRLIHPKIQDKNLGFSLDHLGPMVVLFWPKDVLSEVDLRRFSEISKGIGRPIWARCSDKERSPSTEPQGFVIDPDQKIKDKDEKEWTACEGAIKYKIRKSHGGLFLNQRLQRHWIFKNSENKTVLNLFSGTGTAGVAAALGLARAVTHVEFSKTALKWNQENFQLNHLSSEHYKFLNRDSISFLEQCVAKNNKFDLIICDVPAFFRREKSIFKIEKDLESFLEKTFSCLSEQGQLLLSTSSESFLIDDIRSLILKVQKRMKIKFLQISCILPSLDFELPHERVTLKSFLIEISET